MGESACLDHTLFFEGVGPGDLGFVGLYEIAVSLEQAVTVVIDVKLRAFNGFGGNPVEEGFCDLYSLVDELSDFYGLRFLSRQISSKYSNSELPMLNKKRCPIKIDGY